MRYRLREFLHDLSCLLIVCVMTVTAHAQVFVRQADYQWGNVAMGGGGAVTGVVVHPKVADLVYVRTDVGGAYRWDAAEGKWTPLLDHLPPAEWNLYGVDSLCVDPNDALGNKVYITTGKYTDSWAGVSGMVMLSTDRGRTWSRGGLSPTGASNRDQAFGERLAVDPANSRHVMYASRKGGLFDSYDAGVTWQSVAASPKGQSPDHPDASLRGNGLAFVLFDTSSGILANPLRTRRIFAGATGEGIYSSQDGGKKWLLMTGSPRNPVRGVIAADGVMVVTHHVGVSIYERNAWRDISPADQGKKILPGGAVAIDPHNSRHILVGCGSGHQVQLFRTEDSGNTWLPIRGKRNQTCAWWPGWHWLSAVSSLAFDPAHPGKAWATDWYGVYSTPDVTAENPIWSNDVRGIEETVTTGALAAPPQGPVRLLSGVADNGGLDHESLVIPPARDIWSKGLSLGLTRTGIAVSKARPGLFVAVGIQDWDKPGTGGYSLDFGATWHVFKNRPYAEIKGGRVVLSDAGRRIVWAPQKGKLYYSDDLGDSWHMSQCQDDLSGVAGGNGVFVYDQPLAADADDQRVYALNKNKLYISNNGGASFMRVNGELPDYWRRKLIATTISGDLWLAAGDKGLHHSENGGQNFQKIASVQFAELIAYGREPPGRTHPAIFIMGEISGQSGYFRSDDMAKTWLRIDIPSQRIGNDPNTMTGDPRVFGGIFVGTNGRGIFYGRPADAAAVTGNFIPGGSLRAATAPGRAVAGGL